MLLNVFDHVESLLNLPITITIAKLSFEEHSLIITYL